MINVEDSYLVYTDGSCYKGTGAWAWVAIDSEYSEQLEGGSVYETTNNRMEMTAVAEALTTLYEYAGPCTVLVISDSQYVVQGSMDRTRKRNVNVDLWLWIDEAIDVHDEVHLEHTPGHAGNYWNEMVDKLAGELRIGAVANASNSD